MKQFPIRLNPCDFAHLPIFTQLEANNVFTIYDDIIVYDFNGGTYHSGY